MAKKKKFTINDWDREQWVDNDEYWYDECRRWRIHNKGGQRGFVRAHREEMDKYIREATGFE